MLHPNVAEPVGLRDRAIPEVYACGLRRLEMVRLKLFDLQLDRSLIMVRQAKGKTDQYAPIGERATAWLRRYIVEARPALTLEPDDLSVFLTGNGGLFDRSYPSLIVRRHIAAALTGKRGSRHLFRLTMATHMHENGADIRFIQQIFIQQIFIRQILGHEEIKSTQVYTRVALRMLRQVYASTHPAAFLDSADETLPASGDPVQRVRQAPDAEAGEEQEDV